jgi:hypothetical protein
VPDYARGMPDTGAAATGVNRSTILRAIKAGKLSAERDGSIQPVELHRLFPPLPQLPAVVEPVQNAGHGTEVALLRTLVEEMRATITDLRADQSPRTPRMRTGSSGRGNGRGDGSAKIGRSRARV